MSEVVVPDEILDRVNKLIELARKHVQRYAGESLPMFHLFKNGDRLEIIGAPFTGETQADVEYTKEQIERTIKTLCIDPEVEMVAFLSEAWSVMIQGDENLKRFYAERAQGKWQPLSRHPNAAEVMVLMVETSSFGMTGQAIIRRENGAKVVGPIKWTEGTKHGRFVDFFALRRKHGVRS